jgi:putative addiction module component (TIGR02574 family)
LVKLKAMKTIDLSKMTNEEKINLISEIHESMNAKQISDKVKETLDKRIDRIEKGLATFFTLEELKNRINLLK